LRLSGFSPFSFSPCGSMCPMSGQASIFRSEASKRSPAMAR
jgi:hypothetical protein